MREFSFLIDLANGEQYIEYIGEGRGGGVGGRGDGQTECIMGDSKISDSKHLESKPQQFRTILDKGSS